MPTCLRDKRGVCKAATSAADERDDAGRKDCDAGSRQNQPAYLAPVRNRGRAPAQASERKRFQFANPISQRVASSHEDEPNVCKTLASSEPDATLRGKGVDRAGLNRLSGSQVWRCSRDAEICRNHPPIADFSSFSLNRHITAKMAM